MAKSAKQIVKELEAARDSKVEGVMAALGSFFADKSDDGSAEMILETAYFRWCDADAAVKSAKAAP